MVFNSVPQKGLMAALNRHRQSLKLFFPCVNFSHENSLVVIYKTRAIPGAIKRSFLMCEDKFEINKQRHKPTLLAAPLLVPNSVNFAINRALLTV